MEEEVILVHNLKDNDNDSIEDMATSRENMIVGKERN